MGRVNLLETPRLSLLWSPALRLVAQILILLCFGFQQWTHAWSVVWHRHLFSSSQAPPVVCVLFHQHDSSHHRPCCVFISSSRQPTFSLLSLPTIHCKHSLLCPSYCTNSRLLDAAASIKSSIYKDQEALLGTKNVRLPTVTLTLVTGCLAKGKSSADLTLLVSSH